MNGTPHRASPPPAEAPSEPGATRNVPPESPVPEEESAAGEEDPGAALDELDLPPPQPPAV